MTRLCVILAALLGAGDIANGVYMLVSPDSWYYAVPGVTTTGPYNQHFIRDIGIVFVFLGVGYLLGAAKPALRTWLWAASSSWLCGHALFHVWEVAAGICSASALSRDFSLVTLPAVLGVAVTAWAARGGGASRHAVARRVAAGPEPSAANL